MHGSVEKEEFKSKAIQPYLERADGNEELALDLFSDGNDPGIYQQFGLGEKNYEEALEGERLIVADVAKGHFYALLYDNGNWWNYDSYHQAKPTLIGDKKAAMQHLEKKGQPVWA